MSAKTERRHSAQKVKPAGLWRSKALAVFLMSLSTPAYAECSDPLDAPRFQPALDWIAANETYIDSLVIAKCGEILVEQYWIGFSADRMHEQQSATKSFSSALIGIAIRDGLIKDLDQPLRQLLPNYADLLTEDKAGITLRHLLTMTSGLKWTDFGDGNSFERVAAADDSIAFILKEPLVSKPGEAFFYNTGSSHLLSAIVTALTGQSALEYAQTHLFTPLGITNVNWPALSDGINQGGWGMDLAPKDMMRFGQMILNGGTYGGRRILPESYVTDATRAHVPTYYGSDYGFQFWIESNLGPYPVSAARGYGGQDILIIEDLDAVVTFTGNICCPRDMAEDVASLMTNHIVPALAGH